MDYRDDPTDQSEQYEPVIWAGHDPLAWIAAATGVLLSGFLLAAAVAQWGLPAAVVAVVILVLALLWVARRLLVRQGD